VAGSAWMHHQLRVRQFPQEGAGAAGMVQMHVGHNDVGDFLGASSPAPQHLQDTWRTAAVAHLDESNGRVRFEQVAGRHQGPHLPAVDGDNAALVFECRDTRCHVSSAGSGDYRNATFSRLAER